MKILIIILLIGIVVYIIRKKQYEKYEKTDYYRQTHNSFNNLLSDKGKLGEYYTYKKLEKIDGYKRFLFNLYIPKGNGETTELDVILLHESGIYVMESKNYSGWIFGSESQQYWTQSLSVGKGRTQKNRFYNPILQNSAHIKWLQTYLDDASLPFYSFIVFSDRCELKKITLTSDKHIVLNRYELSYAIRHIAAEAGARLSADEIDRLFEMLYPLSQVDDDEKEQHIKNIQNSTFGKGHNHFNV